MTTENFLSASKKHYNDATTLNAAIRHDNSAYLSGYVVECALKGMIKSSSSLNPRNFGHNVSALSSHVATLGAILSPSRRHLTLPTSQDYIELLAQWKPEERYHAEGTIIDAISTSRLTAAKEAFEAIVVPMILNGSAS